MFIKEKWLQYSSAKGQLPLHLNKGCHKSFRTEGKFKYMRKEGHTHEAIKNTEMCQLELNICRT